MIYNRNSELSREERDYFISVGELRFLDNTDLVNILLHAGEYQDEIDFSGVSELVISFLQNKVKEEWSHSSNETKFKEELGETKLLHLKAGMELYRRILYPFSHVINNPKDLYPLLAHFSLRPEENVYLYTLNAANELLNHHHISRGLVNLAVCHPREVFRLAIMDKATHIILAHNHPSGNLTPSRDDRDVTKRMLRVGQIVGIPLTDHIIFTTDRFYSFRESDSELSTLFNVGSES
ncbi:JAB domain-containing protein [Entomospira entomophila]|uniref:JAB domain-containing protein n=1 Tax=Entomospira entomophila TaxID=2719988 RepID=A0A968KWS2_9SPIO|nr:JAB domain-containing protein [Entomospira entomophilus]NIZ41100.1 JAB domain-containing protein [Entomospira entomophilus]WDI35308.1 JAB domain-containing protein [Entomospira entomophilus]